MPAPCRTEPHTAARANLELRGAARRPASGPAAANPRSLPMDLLRAAAIFLVLGAHCVMLPAGLGPLQPVAEAWKHIGWAGVDLFFVVSGFLVSGLLFAEYRRRGTVDARRFVVRRGFKIWPAYFVYLAVLAAWLWFQQTRGKGDGIVALWPNLLHVQNYFGTPRVHTWSLAVEEHFYLLVALAFAALVAARRAARYLTWVPVVILGLIAALATLRHFAFAAVGPQELNLYATHLRFDGLLVGTLLAYGTTFQAPRLAAFVRRPVTLLVAGIALALPTLTVTPEASAWSAGLGLTAMYFGFGLVVLGWLNLDAIHPWARHLFACRPAAWIGRVGVFSYSIYLWHVDLAQTPVAKLAAYGQAAGVPAGLLWIGVTSLYVGLAIGFGALLARLIETPALALRERWFPSAGPAPVPTAPPPRIETGPTPMLPDAPREPVLIC